MQELAKMLGGGKDALAMVADENSRRCEPMLLVEMKRLLVVF